MTEPAHPVPSSSHITRDGYIGNVDGADFYEFENHAAVSIVSANGPVALREELVNMEKLEELAE